MAAALTSSPRAGEGRTLACLCTNSEVSGPRREAEPQALVRPWQSTQKRGYFVLLECPNPIFFRLWYYYTYKDQFSFPWRRIGARPGLKDFSSRNCVRP